MDRVIFQRSTLLLPEKQRTLPGERPLYHALRGPAACPQAAAAAHGVCELLDPLQGKGRQREGFEGNGHQLHGVVIPRHPVGAELAAPAAPVNHRPLLFFPHPHPDGVHDAAAIRGGWGSGCGGRPPWGWERPAGRRPGRKRYRCSDGFYSNPFQRFFVCFPDSLGRSSSILSLSGEAWR